MLYICGSVDQDITCMNINAYIHMSAHSGDQAEHVRDKVGVEVRRAREALPVRECVSE